MRERDMRLRVERFIQTRLRSMLMPATLGLGMALAGCSGDGLSTDDGGEPIAKQDADSKQDSMATPKYIAPMPDAGPDLSGPAPEYIAPIRQDGGIAVRYMAQMQDGSRDPGPMVAVYTAQMP